jgi:Methyltransferase domain
MTENVSLFLYSLIKCVRPYNIIEVGLGYSTLFLTKAIDDIRNEDLTKEPFFTPEKVSDGYWVHSGPTYAPVLTVVDNQRYKGCEQVIEVLSEEELAQYINLVNMDIKQYTNETSDHYDMIWLDFGPPSTSEYKYYYNTFMNRLNPGGYMIIHSTVSNHIARLFLTELKLSLKGNSDYELMSFVEPHKKQQSSFTIIKKVIDYPVYTVDP